MSGNCSPVITIAPGQRLALLEQRQLLVPPQRLLLLRLARVGRPAGADHRLAPDRRAPHAEVEAGEVTEGEQVGVAVGAGELRVDEGGAQPPPLGPVPAVGRDQVVLRRVRRTSAGRPSTASRDRRRRDRRSSRTATSSTGRCSTGSRSSWSPLDADQLDADLDDGRHVDHATRRRRRSGRRRGTAGAAARAGPCRRRRRRSGRRPWRAHRGRGAGAGGTSRRGCSGPSAPTAAARSSAAVPARTRAAAARSRRRSPPRASCSVFRVSGRGVARGGDLDVVGVERVRLEGLARGRGQLEGHLDEVQLRARPAASGWPGSRRRGFARPVSTRPSQVCRRTVARLASAPATPRRGPARRGAGSGRPRAAEGPCPSPEIRGGAPARAPLFSLGPPFCAPLGHKPGAHSSGPAACPVCPASAPGTGLGRGNRRLCSAGAAIREKP